MAENLTEALTKDGVEKEPTKGLEHHEVPEDSENGVASPPPTSNKSDADISNLPLKTEPAAVEDSDLDLSRILDLSIPDQETNDALERGGIAEGGYQSSEMSETTAVVDFKKMGGEIEAYLKSAISHLAVSPPDEQQPDESTKQKYGESENPQHVEPVQEVIEEVLIGEEQYQIVADEATPIYSTIAEFSDEGVTDNHPPLALPNLQEDRKKLQHSPAASAPTLTSSDHQIASMKEILVTKQAEIQAGDDILRENIENDLPASMALDASSDSHCESSESLDSPEIRANEEIQLSKSESEGESFPLAESEQLEESTGTTPLELALNTSIDDSEHLLQVLMEELAVEDDPTRKGVLQYEIGHILHTSMNNEGRAATAYAQALSLDPSLRPNLWAIRRIFSKQQLWPKLLMLYDAEARFEEDPQRKAEILLEKGWIIQDKLRDLEQAKETFWSSFHINEKWLAPLLALERLAIAQGDLATLTDVYPLIAEVAQEPERKVAALINLARLQSKLANGTPMQALNILERAYVIGVQKLTILFQMEQIARPAGLYKNLVGILRRQAEEYLHPKEGLSNPALAVAKLRVAGQCARRELHDYSLANELLKAALDILPEDSLLQRDAITLAEESGDNQWLESILTAQLEQPHSPQEKAALYYKLGLVRREGNVVGAADAFDAALELVPGHLGVLIEKEYEAFLSGDMAKLAQLYLTEAEAVERRLPGLPLSSQPDPEWAATALWRAAILFRRKLNRMDRAIEVCQQALAICPSFKPAQHELEDLLLQTGRHAELALMLELQLNNNDPSLSLDLLRQLSSLYAGVLDDPEKWADCLRKLHQLQPEEMTHLRWLAHVLEFLGRSDDVCEVLIKLEKLETDELHLCAFKLWRAYLYEHSLHRLDDALRIYRDILSRFPKHAYAFTAVESILWQQEKYEDLAKELHRAANEIFDDPNDASLRIYTLRQLGSIYTRLLNQPQQAAKIYSELLVLQPNDLPTLRDLARTAIAAGDKAQWAEAVENLAKLSKDPNIQAQLYLQLAEIYEDHLVDSYRAEETMAKALSISPEKGNAVDAIDYLVRRQISRGDFSEAIQGLEQLQKIVSPEAVPLVLEERAWIHSGPLEEIEKGDDLWSELLKQHPEHIPALWSKLRTAVRKRDFSNFADLLAKLAQLTSDKGLRVALELRAGLYYNLTDVSNPAGLKAFRRALQENPDNLEALLSLLDQKNVTKDEYTGLLSQLATKVSDAGQADMHLMLAEAFERAGRFNDAVRELDGLLAKDPESLSSLFILQRVFEATKSKDNEAKVWIRIARLLTDPAAKAEAYNYAAMLLFDPAFADEAAILFRQVLAIRPDDNQAFEKLRHIYEDKHDYQGLADLLGHRIRHTEDSGTLIALHFERAKLRIERLDDTAGAVRDLLHILRLDPKHLEALRQLSRLYDDNNNLQNALQLYQRYIESTDSIHLKRPAVIRIAEILHQKQKRTAEAVEICRRFLDLSPDDDRIMELLADLYIEIRDFPRSVGMLERLSDLKTERAWKAKNLQRAGAIYWKNIKDLPQARSTLMRARDIDPSNMEVIRDLRQICRELNCDGDVTQLLERAKEDLLNDLAEQPLNIEVYRKLMQIAEWEGDEYTLLAALGVLCYLNAADLQDQDLYQRRVLSISFEPKRQVGIQTWRESLVVLGARNAYSEIWAVVADSIPKLFEGRIPSEPSAFGVSRSTKVDRKAGGPVSNSLDRMASTFGLHEFDIYLSSDNPELIAGIVSEKSVLVIGHGIITNMDASQRFRIGRTLSLLRDKAFALEVLSRNELEILFSAIIFSVEPSANFSLPRAQIEVESKRIMKSLPRKARRMLPLAVARYMQEGGDLDSWINGVLATANRAGLLVCGDIMVAMSQLVRELRSTKSRTSKSTEQIVEILSQNKPAASLLPYSVSKEYLSLRKELQL